MKVCHITTVHPAKDVRIFHKECCSLAGAGHEVILLAPNSDDEFENGVRIQGLNYSFSNRIQRILLMPIFAFRAALRVHADVYHFHDPEFLPWALLLIQKGKTVIYDVHEDVPRQIAAKTWIPRFLRNTTSIIFELFEDWAARRMSFVVTATPFINRRFLKKTPNSINVNNYPMLKEMTILDRHENNDKGYEICYIGAITKVRGIVNIVKAIRDSEYQLHLAGSFDSKELKNECMGDLGWKNVIDHGYVSREDVVEIMRKSKVGVVTLLPIPNHINSRPNKMFEYMCAGLPVIASDFPLWKDIIENNACGICVDPSSVSSIRAGLDDLFSDINKARIMGENGHKVVVDEFNWENEANKLKDLYSLLEKNKN